MQPLAIDAVLREIIKENPSFADIPKASQWTVALRAGGHSCEAVSGVTGQSVSAINTQWDRYGDLAVEMGDVESIMMARVMAIKAINPLVSTLYSSEMDATQKKASIATATDVAGLVSVLTRLAKDMKAAGTGADEMDFDTFGKSLKEKNGEKT